MWPQCENLTLNGVKENEPSGHTQQTVPRTTGGRLNELFLHARLLDVQLFLLIDEYDNFANTILAGEGEAAYHSLTHLHARGSPSRSPAEGSGSGFFRDFFATLKAGTASGNLERLFITGVSPVTMDDVTSGFNIGTNIGFDAAYKPHGGLHREGSGRFGEDIPRRRISYAAIWRTSDWPCSTPPFDSPVLRWCFEDGSLLAPRRLLEPQPSEPASLRQTLRSP